MPWSAGLKRPIGPFIGALVYVLLRTFALDVLVSLGLDGQRFQLLIGIGFLAIVFFSPDGLLGLWERWKAHMRRSQKAASRRAGRRTGDADRRRTPVRRRHRECT